MRYVIFDLNNILLFFICLMMYIFFCTSSILDDLSLEIFLGYFLLYYACVLGIDIPDCVFISGSFEGGYSYYSSIFENTSYAKLRGVRYYPDKPTQPA